MKAESDLNTLLKSLNPVLHSGQYVFCTVESAASIDLDETVMTFTEKEGTTIIILKETADKLNLKYDFVAAWITLTVHSSLEAVGLTSVFSSALAQNGIGCNVVAGYYHDHLFVASAAAEKAMEILRSISG